MDRGSISVICNLSRSERSFPLSTPTQVLLASCSAVHVNEGAVTLPSDTVAILRVNRTTVGDAGDKPHFGSD
jgi:hypothetical protein